MQLARPLTICAIVMFTNPAGMALAAELTPVSQSRTILGDSNVIGPSAPMQDIQEVVSPNFGVFDETLTTAASSPNGTTNVEAFQHSTIDNCSLTASGGFESFAQNAPPGVVAYSVGSSVYRVTFSLNQQTTCRIVGTLDADEATHSRIMLQQQAIGLVNLLATGVTLPVAEQRVLAPGQYTFTVQAMGTAAAPDRGTHDAFGQYSVKLSICFDPADLNIDGTVNITDLLRVVGAWGPCTVPAGECLPDVTLDGAVNISDLLAVVSSWG